MYFFFYVIIYLGDIMESILFRKLNDNEGDYLKLYNWCQNKYVYEWFEQRILSYDEIVNKYRNKLKEGKQDLYIITLDNKDIGFVQIYKFDDDINIGIDDAYEYDIFIGEEDYIGKGIGKEVIKNINNFIYEKYKTHDIIIRPFKRNIRAVKCYLKCGFKEVLEYQGIDTLGNKEDVAVLLNRFDK